MTHAKVFLADLFGSQDLFEINHISFTNKNSEIIVKTGCFE